MWPGALVPTPQLWVTRHSQRMRTVSPWSSEAQKTQTQVTQQSAARHTIIKSFPSGMKKPLESRENR